jgi:hypothetical protein
MATGSAAEHYARLKGREPRTYAGDQAAVDDALLEQDVEHGELYGHRTGRTVTVPEVFEATAHCRFDDENGRPWYLRGSSPRGRLGTVVQKGHPILKAHPELFEPLRLPVDYPWPPPDLE